MAKPNQPREIAPKERQIEPAKNNNIQIVIINTITTILVCCVFVFANYYIQNTLLNEKLASQEDIVEDVLVEEDTIERGIVYNLGEFTMNLADANARRYLKAEVSIELSKTEAERIIKEEKKASGHEETSSSSSTEAFEKEMFQYKAAMRDAVINSLSSKTSDELLSVTGREVAKEQIAQSIDAILAGEREVLRVSFGQFIMQ